MQSEGRSTCVRFLTCLFSDISTFKVFPKNVDGYGGMVDDGRAVSGGRKMERVEREFELLCESICSVLDFRYSENRAAMALT